jgi:hypothetical protein
VILNWNNKPGAGFSASDDNWSYGPVQRVQLLQQAVARRKVHTFASLVGAMNQAATQDLRAVEVLPALSKALGPDAASDPLFQLMEAWRQKGASRLDRDLDGKIDDPGAAIMDAAWPGIARAVMRPELGPLTSRLESLVPIDDPANAGGSSYYNGWYSYVVKDLNGGFASGPFCPPASCATLIRDAIDAAGKELAARQGPDPSQWRADATSERIRFGFLPQTARWTNRPTFQQVISFASHRRR